MVAFDWIALLNERGIFYRISGPNTSKGHLVFACPFCGAGDPSEHMSVAISGAGWKCWRNADHRGAQPHKLLAALGLTRAEINAVVGEQAPAITEDIFSQVSAILTGAVPEPPPQPLVMPADFRLLEPGKLAAQPYLNYLAGRHLTFEQVQSYGLRYAISGDYQGRIIFPVYDCKSQLMGWTARACGKLATLRYKDEGPIKNYLWRENVLAACSSEPTRSGWMAHTLVICEGPFDALKVSVLGWQFGIVGTCVFTSYPSAAQMVTLMWARRSFNRIVALFDQGNEAATLRLVESLPFVTAAWLPPHISDPGELRDVVWLAAEGAGRPGRARPGVRA